MLKKGTYQGLLFFSSVLGAFRDLSCVVLFLLFYPFLALSSTFLTPTVQFLHHLSIHYFTFLGPILLQKKYPLIQNPGRLYTECSLYNSMAPFTWLGEVLLSFARDSFESLHFLAPLIWGAVARRGMHLRPQIPLPCTHTAHSTSERTAAPLSHQDCLSFS